MSLTFGQKSSFCVSKPASSITTAEPLLCGAPLAGDPGYHGRLHTLVPSV